MTEGKCCRGDVKAANLITKPEVQEEATMIDSSNRFSVVDTVSFISDDDLDLSYSFKSSCVDDNDEDDAVVAVELQKLDEEEKSDTPTSQQEEAKKRIQQQQQHSLLLSNSSSSKSNNEEEAEEAEGEYEVPEFIIKKDNNATNKKTTTGQPRQQRQQRRSSVSFNHVQIRRYAIVLGDNPSVETGAPISIGWSYEELPELDLEDYETLRQKSRRTRLRDLLLSYYQRRDLLLRNGYSQEEQYEVEKQISKTRWQRMTTTTLLPISKIEEIVQSAKRKVKRRLNKK